MNFYGVGVKLGGHTPESEDILQECIDNNVWYMGFRAGEKPEFEKLISQVKKGDIIFAKSLHQAWKDEMRIKAIGFVTDEPLPDGYKEYSSISVRWFKKFEPSINFEYLGMNFIEGINRRNTIFQEENTKIISEVKKLMIDNSERKKKP